MIKRTWSPKAKKLNPFSPEHMGPLTPTLVRDLFKLVDDASFDALGFSCASSHPKNFIIKTLLVPPPIIRPAISTSEGSHSRGQDDLTIKLQEILKLIQKFSPPVNSSFIEELQLSVASYMNQDNSKVSRSMSSKATHTQFKCLVERLKGKKGRFRGNLMGKRVNFSSRTVISPDTQLDVDEIGIPFECAKILTFKEKVTAYNINELTARVHRGHRPLDGAYAYVTNTGKRIRLEFCKDIANIRLWIGWTVERYLQDGDVVLFNRQPSLRKKSIMAHRVRLMPGRTFRLNLCCTTPYNA
jgi:DNA-directed RNA polymerase beta' subunit